MLEYAKGISFPFQFGKKGQVKVSTADYYDDLHIRESIYQILLTNIGERRMEPEFGSNLRKLIFENNSIAFDTIICNLTKTAIERWEKRITVENLEIIREYGTIVIRINYTILQTQITTTGDFTIRGWE
jgi:phage baseplate assembly protein W